MANSNSAHQCKRRLRYMALEGRAARRKSHTRYGRA